MRGRLKEVLPLSGGEWQISFTTRENPRKIFDRLKGKPVKIEIADAGQKRSNDANAFCWALCSDIGKAITPPVDKETIYRQAIRAVGVYSSAEVVAWDIETLQKRWSEHGTGWFIDVMDSANIGRRLVHMYFGSSTYTVSEMRLLIDWLVDQAEQMEIPIPLSKAETERMLIQWGKKKEGQKDG